MLARDLLQAIVIGAGWTAFLGAVGLKSEYARRKEKKDDVSNKLEALIGCNPPEMPTPSSELRELKNEARIARAL
ncbi:MAG TPA: hypothetical protein VI197_06395 [Polyangiaceae bacterium]